MSNIDISVVSGTYNRLPFLQKMVASARRALGLPGLEGVGVYGLRHEFVLVDGGSTDGTIEWCRQQPDIRLIEHGQLKGAIKAFNDGAYAAVGTYVIMANDDIEFVDWGILRAWIEMQTHPDYGAGCFYQDRGRTSSAEHVKWHIELMPVVANGVQASWPYAQVGIFPKALGDRVGWWGEWHHRDTPTYGGDNELSCQVYAAGYRVRPLYFGPNPEPPQNLKHHGEGCCIHDSEPDDGLRSLNNEGAHDPRHLARSHKRGHPDSWAWGQRWRDKSTGMTGPRIVQEPQFQLNTPVKERVLYLPIYEQGWPVQYEQKRGLREALAEVALTVEYDYVGRHAAVGQEKMMVEVEELCRRIQPTLVLTQCHGPEPIGPEQVGRLRRSVPNTRFVNWNGDYWPQNLTTPEGIALARAFDLQLTVNRSVLEQYQSQGVEANYWQIGWEPDGVGHDPEPDTPRYDVVFLASGYSRDRQRFVARLRNLGGMTFGLWGNGWPDGWSDGQCLYDFETACRLYRGAKISIGDSQWPESGFVSNRVMQALAAGGAALAHQWFRGMDQLGLVDGQTCIIWRTFDELVEKLNHYLTHEDERRKVAEAGQRLALERHSFDARVGELFEMLGQGVTVGSGVEDWR